MQIFKNLTRWFYIFFTIFLKKDINYMLRKYDIEFSDMSQVDTTFNNDYCTKNNYWINN